MAEVYGEINVDVAKESTLKTLISNSGSLVDTDTTKMKIATSGKESASTTSTKRTFSFTGKKKIHQVWLVCTDSTFNNNVYGCDDVTIAVDGTTYDFSGAGSSTTTTSNTSGSRRHILVRNPRDSAYYGNLVVHFTTPSEYYYYNEPATFVVEENFSISVSIKTSSSTTNVAIIVLYEDL